MFLSRNKRNNVYSCKPQIYCTKVGFKGIKIILLCFRDGNSNIAVTRYIRLPTLLSGFTCCDASIVFIFFNGCHFASYLLSIYIFLIFSELPQKTRATFRASNIMKTRLYRFDPLKPHFYTVKLGFTGIYIIILISAQKHRLWVLVRTASPRWF